MSRPAIRAAASRHPDAANWLDAWWIVADHAIWERLEDVRRDFPATDQVDCCLIFDCRGNRYGFVVRVTYADAHQRGTLLVKHFLTHADYNKNYWRKDCRP